MLAHVWRLNGKCRMRCRAILRDYIAEVLNCSRGNLLCGLTGWLVVLTFNQIFQLSLEIIACVLLCSALENFFEVFLICLSWNFPKTLTGKFVFFLQFRTFGTHSFNFLLQTLKRRYWPNFGVWWGASYLAKLSTRIIYIGLVVSDISSWASHRCNTSKTCPGKDCRRFLGQSWRWSVTFLHLIHSCLKRLCQQVWSITNFEGLATGIEFGRIQSTKAFLVISNVLHQGARSFTIHCGWLVFGVSGLFSTLLLLVSNQVTQRPLLVLPNELT